MAEYLLRVVSIPLQKAKKLIICSVITESVMSLDAKIDKTLSKIEQISALRTCGSASNSRIIAPDLSNYRIFEFSNPRIIEKKNSPPNPQEL